MEAKKRYPGKTTTITSDSRKDVLMFEIGLGLIPNELMIY